MEVVDQEAGEGDVVLGLGAAGPGGVGFGGAGASGILSESFGQEVVQGGTT